MQNATDDIFFSLIVSERCPVRRSQVALFSIANREDDDLGGFWSGTLLTSVGLDAAGAQANGRYGASPSFAKFNLSIERVQPFWTEFSALVRASGQMTQGTVPSSEVFAYGGREYGRAFNVAESVGDRGVSVLGELRYNPSWLPLPKNIVDAQFYAFADHGWISSVSPLNPSYFPEGSSVGAGVRVKAWEKWGGEVELAKVVGTPIVGDRPWRASFRFGTRF